MLLFILMPLLLIGLPLLMLRLGVLAALGAKRLAEQHQSSAYPTAEVLETTFEPEGIWPPKPSISL